MADLKTRLSLDGSDFTRGMNDASKSVEDFTDASKMSASELLNQMKSMDKLGRSTSNYRSQLATMTKQIQDLRINYQAMSEEMKKSDFGQAVASKIQELTARASEMKDALQDAQASVKLLASDTANLDAFKMGVEGISSALSLMASTGVLGADSTEKLVKVIARLKAIEAATNAVIKIANILNKDSILMLKLKELWTKLNTAATNKNTAAQLANNKAVQSGAGKMAAATAATKGATTATAGLTTGVKALSVGLKGGLIGAIIALIAVYAVWSEKQHLEIELSRRVKKRTEEEEEAIKHYGTTVGSSIGKAVATFDSLKRKFDDLTTVSEKKKFLDEYSESLKQVGIYANNVNDLEEIFVNNTEKYRKAIIQRAKAAALQSLIEEEYSKQYQRAATSAESHKYSTGDNFGGQFKPQEFFDLKGLIEGVDYTVIDRDFYGNIIAELTGTGADKLNASLDGMLEDGARRIAEKNTATYIRLIEQIAKENEELGLLDPRGGSSGGGTSTTTTEEVEIVYTEGSYAEAQAMVQQLRKELENLDPSTEEFRAVKFELESWQESLNEITEAMGRTKKETPLVAGSYAEAAAMVAKLTTQLQNLDPSTIEFSNVREELIEWQSKLEEIKVLMGETTEQAENLAKVDPFANWKNGLSTVNSLESSFSGMYSSIKNISEAFEDCEDPLQSLFTVIDNVLSLLSNITSVLEIINTLEEISVATQLAKNMAEKQETQESIKQAILNATNLSTEQAEAIAASVKAAAEAGSSASKIPYVGWAIAIGAIAAIIAAIAAAKSGVGFAKGGIVPGSSFSGDNISANLNSGEMVLNTTQQKNLFDMLNTGSTDRGGKVEFVIKGQELKGVLNNYDKKMSRI